MASPPSPANRKPALDRESLAAGSTWGIATLTASATIWYLYRVVYNPRISMMADTTALYALRFPDGSVSLYIDEHYAQERGVDPSKLVRVEIPREIFINGSVQDVREYVALYLETHQQQTGTA
jgi:hypothetical protein